MEKSCVPWQERLKFLLGRDEHEARSDDVFAERIGRQNGQQPGEDHRDALSHGARTSMRNHGSGSRCAKDP